MIGKWERDLAVAAVWLASSSNLAPRTNFSLSLLVWLQLILVNWGGRVGGGGDRGCEKVGENGGGGGGWGKEKARHPTGWELQARQGKDQA